MKLLKCRFSKKKADKAWNKGYHNNDEGWDCNNNYLLVYDKAGITNTISQIAIEGECWICNRIEQALLKTKNSLPLRGTLKIWGDINDLEIKRENSQKRTTLT